MITPQYFLPAFPKIVIRAMILVGLFVSWNINTLLAQDDIPQSSGLSGYFLIAPGYFGIANSLVASGPPLISDPGNKQIQSIFDRPETKGASALGVAGEINYTFGKSRTQIFLGNRLEDVLRLDVPFGLGIRHELKDSSILGASFLITPLELKFWADPFVEGEDRNKSGLNYPGIRLRWGRIFKTGLELTATYRLFRHGKELSGQWLVEQGRLAPEDQALLVRDGNSLRLQALYRIEKGRHRFEPAIRYAGDFREGAAVARQGFSLQLTYLYRSKGLIIDANLGYGKRYGKATHPVYDVQIQTDRAGAALNLIFPFKYTKNSMFSFMLIAEHLRENANVDFYSSQVNAIMLAFSWRHIRK